MTPHPASDAARRAVCDALRDGRTFVVTSHVRPDGDAIGSSVALALALQAAGKQARVVFCDRLPDPYPEFPRTGEIAFADRLDDDGSVVVVLECGDLDRTGLAGLDRHTVVNIDHHPGNTGYGDVQWFDGTAAACAEMVYEIIRDLGVGVTADMAAHLYVAIVTDTGSFRYPGVSPRTFEICARLVEAGADPVAVGRLLYDGSTLGRVRLQAAVLGTLEVPGDGEIATLAVDPGMIAAAGAEPEDTDGLINIALSVKHIRAVAFFKTGEPGQVRVSMRSKGPVDVGAVARGFGGGGHRNAAGCTLAGTPADVRAQILDQLRTAIAAAHDADARTRHA
jgi:phosphoesterase RecJ-like protein